MSQSSSRARFATLAAQAREGLTMERFWKLQIAARDALMEVDSSSAADPGAAMEAMTDILMRLCGGTSGSLIVREPEGWRIRGVAGNTETRLLGTAIHAEGTSVTARVIRSGEPFYFSSIDEVGEACRGERYHSELFCSLPVTDLAGRVIAVVNVAGMPEAHPIFSQEQSSLNGLLGAVGAKLAKLAKNRDVQLLTAERDRMRRNETDRERLLFMTIHDYKNPLSLVISNLSYLEMGELPEEAREMVQLSRFGCERLLDMVKSTLDSYRMDNGVLRLQAVEYDLAALCRKLSAEFSVAAKFDDVTVTCEAPETCTVHGDDGLVRRTLGNLLDNALKFSPIGGAVTVRLETGDDEVSITVADQGEGIPPGEQARLFDAFAQVEEAQGTGDDGKRREGHGLGLAFCRMAAEAHGGRITLASIPGHGSAFTLTLPLRV